jgi:hypothetical protein
MEHMLGWLLRTALALIVLKMAVAVLGRRTTPPGQRFSPPPPPHRAKWREERVRGTEVDPRTISDAEYEEIPGAGR